MSDLENIAFVVKVPMNPPPVLTDDERASFEYRPFRSVAWLPRRCEQPA